MATQRSDPERYCPICGRAWDKNFTQEHNCSIRSVTTMDAMDEASTFVTIGLPVIRREAELTIHEALIECFYMHSNEESWDVIRAGEHWPRTR